MFPFYKNFLEKSAVEIFDNLDKIPYYVSNEDYRLYSYYPKYKLFSKRLFRNEYVTVGVFPNITYEDGDVLSDLFLEELRISARRNDDVPLKEKWKDTVWRKGIIDIVSKKVSKSDKKLFNSELRREIKHHFAEVQNFSVVKGMAILKLVLGKTKGKKWLDISAGWGDRLLIAMKLKMIYHSCDPNLDLEPYHDQMIKNFGNNEDHKIEYIPFEKKIITDKYDVVFSSPPYFDLEIYNVEGEQSINTYSNFDVWIVNFLFASIKKAWDSLKFGGYLILHLGDTKTIKMCEPTNLFIQSELEGSSFHGVIGLKGQSGYARPVWVWQKFADRNSLISDQKILNKDNEFTLLDKYPNFVKND